MYKEFNIPPEELVQNSQRSMKQVTTYSLRYQRQKF